MIQNIAYIWQQRLENKDDTQNDAFQYDDHFHLDNQFDSNNYLDECISDFRDVLEALKIGYKSDLLNDDFNIEQYDNGPFRTALIGEDISIYHRLKMDQHTFLISFDEEFIEKDAIISIYKSRGRIEAFYFVDTYQPVNIIYMTNLLIALGLEKHQDGDYAFKAFL